MQSFSTTSQLRIGNYNFENYRQGLTAINLSYLKIQVYVNKMTQDKAMQVGILTYIHKMNSNRQVQRSSVLTTKPQSPRPYYYRSSIMSNFIASFHLPLSPVDLSFFTPISQNKNASPHRFNISRFSPSLYRFLFRDNFSALFLCSNFLALRPGGIHLR